MVHHPRTGWNLLMTGSDLLDGDTDTPVVSQRSESGSGILGVKEGRSTWLWSVVVVVLLSHMSVVGFSLAGRHDNV